MITVGTAVCSAAGHALPPVHGDLGIATVHCALAQAWRGRPDRHRRHRL